MLLYLTPLWTLWPTASSGRPIQRWLSRLPDSASEPHHFCILNAFSLPGSWNYMFRGIWIRLELLSQILVASPHTDIISNPGEGICWNPGTQPKGGRTWITMFQVRVRFSALFWKCETRSLRCWLTKAVIWSVLHKHFPIRKALPVGLSQVKPF